MAAVGFEEDVAFAKSLFTDRLAQIYKELEYQHNYAVDSMRSFWLEMQWRVLKSRAEKC